MRQTNLIRLMMLAAMVGRAQTFQTSVLPVLQRECFGCHGEGQTLSKLDLRTREAMLRGGQRGPAIVPGKAGESLVVKALEGVGAAQMPPGKKLPPDVVTAVRRWIDDGASWTEAKSVSQWTYKDEDLWAFRPVRADNNRRIDDFIKPGPKADRRTLIRRLALDLTGIPSTPAEVEAFVRDKSPEAYTKLVDRMLTSPRYAEKQSLYWLDAVRYADTCGFHGDNPFPAWPYRDYVLNSFRDNKPFDAFTREQLAGDLMPNATVEQRVASAYNRMNRTSAEGGLQPKEYLAKYGADRVRATVAVWLGSTLGCAECHDHKFDPFTARDFYSFKAFFADIKETGLVPDRGPTAWGSQLELPSPDQASRMDKLRERIAEVKAKLDAVSPGKRDAGDVKWRYQRPLTAKSSGGADLQIYNDRPVDNTYQEGASIVSERKNGEGLIIATGPVPENDTYTVTFKPGSGTWTALAIEAVQDESLAGIRTARGSDRLVVTEVEADVNGQRAPFVLASSNLAFPAAEYPAMAAIDGNSKTGWGVSTYGHNSNLALALRFAKPVVADAEAVVTLRVRHDSDSRRATIGRMRVAMSMGLHSWPRPDGLPDAASKAMYEKWADPALEPLNVEMALLEAERDMLNAAIPRVVVSEATMPEPTRVLPRGNFLDESGPVVEPAIPAFLGRLETGARRATRLDLANWLVSEANPLTARVWVNRTWRQLFGTGLSRVLDDVGSQGEPPTHPELLDWLAAEFVKPTWNAQGAHAWDMRHMVRTIVTSDTYRQSSSPRQDLQQLDADNRLLARQSRLRVDGETVRDIVLASSGLLTEKFGGPSIRPLQPDGFLAALNFPKRDYSATRGPDLYRRGVYVFWQRSFLHPEMSMFDAPSREECSVNRTTSNTPLQALVLLNDPTYVEAARVFAQNMWKDGGRSLDARIDWAFQRAIGRRPHVEERRTLVDLYRKSLGRFRADSASAREVLGVGDAPQLERAKQDEVAALAIVARAILNTHEVITRN